jgi:hypothetical protein
MIAQSILNTCGLQWRGIRCDLGENACPRLNLHWLVKLQWRARLLDSSAQRKTMCRQLLASDATRERSSLYLDPSTANNFPIAINFSLLRNGAPRVSGPAISPHVDCAPRHRSTTVELLGARCKQCARPGDADDNTDALGVPPTARFTDLGM